MLNIEYLRNNTEEAIRRLAKRGLDAEKIVREILELDEKRRHLQQQLDTLRAQLNQTTSRIGQLMREGKQQEAQQEKEKATHLKQQIRTIEQEFETVEQRWTEALTTTPNLPHESVPDGSDESGNVVVEQWGEVPPPTGVAHWDIGVRTGMVSSELGALLAGSGFVVFAGWGVRLQMALINFFLKSAIEEGYIPISPPHLVNKDTAFGTGQLPDKDRQMYYIEEDELYLIPTAEVPVTNLVRGAVLKEEDLPLRMVSYTPCFRREAGSWGQMTRGLNRVHQFDKVEIVHIVHPDQSYEELERMCEYVSRLLKKLNLPHRRVLLCGGDLGFASAKTYDMEVYARGQDRWLEVSSISNFEDFQARRMKTRLKLKNGKTVYPHTLNGSALALARLIAAILENNWDGEKLQVPPPLQEYLGTQYIYPEEKPLPVWR